MLNMVNGADNACPFEFNFDPLTFKVGDLVSYRVPEAFDDMPFVGELVVVADDHVMLVHHDPTQKNPKAMRGSRESRPVVSAADALA